MGVPGVVVSPFIWSSPDYLGNVISVTVNFDDVTKLLTSVTTFRDAACVYKNIYFGLGADGTPNASSQAFGGVPNGVTTVLAALLNSLGFTTINDVLAGQITAGP